MGSRTFFLSILLAGLFVCAGAGAAHSEPSVRPAIRTDDGATWLVVTVTSRTGFTARTRPRGVTVVAGRLRLVLRRSSAGPAGRLWTTARLRGAQGAALKSLAGKGVVIEVRSRAGSTRVRRLLPPLPPPPDVQGPPSQPVPAPKPPPQPPPQPPATPAAPKSEQALAVARQYLGTPFKWGGASPATGFDSPGLTQYAYGQVGVVLPRIAQDQFGVGAAVSRESLRLGDLVFFRDTTGYVFHVGLFAGDAQFLHAAYAGDVIKYSSLNEPYYAQQFAGARRVAE